MAPSCPLDHRHRSEAPGDCAFRQLLRIEGLGAGAPGRADGGDGADHAGRRFRGADRCAEVHHGLREVAWTISRHEARDTAANRDAPGRHRFLDRIQPRDHPLDVAVHHRGALPERDRGDGGGRIVADPRQGPERHLGRREAAAVARNHRGRAIVEVAGAGVIAEARPPPAAPSRAVPRPAPRRWARARGSGCNNPSRRDGRLLEHHLRQPDRIGIGLRMALGAPRQAAAMPIVPGENRDRRRGRWGCGEDGGRVTMLDSGSGPMGVRSMSCRRGQAPA